MQKYAKLVLKNAKVHNTINKYALDTKVFKMQMFLNMLKLKICTVM